MARDELDRDVDRELARLAAATEGVTPADSFTEAVMSAAASVRPAGDPIGGIARATSSLDADAALTAAVMARVAPARRAPSASWLDGVVRSAPLSIGLAAAAAAACLWFFASSQSDLDASVVSSVDAVEVSE